MALEGVDGRHDALAMRGEHGLARGPGAVAFGHQSRVRANVPDRHAARAKVPQKSDPPDVTIAVAAVAARGIALDAAGASPRHLIKLTTFVTDLSHLPVFRQVRDQFLDVEHQPASTLVQVSRLFRPEFLIEIEAMAYR